MKVITTVAKETLDAIKLGHDTNLKLSKYLLGGVDTMGSRTSRLRRLGLLSVERVNHSEYKNKPLRYTVIDQPYTVSDAILRSGAKRKDNPPKTYEAQGENIYSNLDAFLYPHRGE